LRHHRIERSCSFKKGQSISSIIPRNRVTCPYTWVFQWLSIDKTPRQHWWRGIFSRKLNVSYYIPEENTTRVTFIHILYVIFYRGLYKMSKVGRREKLF
jgi:hypothetical protein